MSRSGLSGRPIRSETERADGSSLPELLLAASLVLVVLNMLGGSVLAPIAAMLRAGAVDERQVELDQAAETAVRIIGAARAGIGSPAVSAADRHRVELLIGDARSTRTVALVLHDGALVVEIEGALTGDPLEMPTTVSAVIPPPGPLVDGLDMQRSQFNVQSADELRSDVVAGVGTVEGVALADIVHIEVILHDRPAEDGMLGISVSRSAHLRLRLPLAAGARQ